CLATGIHRPAARIGGPAPARLAPLPDFAPANRGAREARRSVTLDASAALTKTPSTTVSCTSGPRRSGAAATSAHRVLPSARYVSPAIPYDSVCQPASCRSCPALASISVRGRRATFHPLRAGSSPRLTALWAANPRCNQPNSPLPSPWFCGVFGLPHEIYEVPT